jgi:hypothetical protein
VGRFRFRGSGDDDGARHIGRNVIVLLILSVVAAVLMARIFRLGVPAIVSGGALPSLYMAWEGLRRTGKAAGKSGAPPDDAGKLAGIVQEQWDKEYKDRTLNDPAQELRDLKVSWSAADASLAVHWDALVEVARGPSGRKGMPPREWATSPLWLTGIELELPKILERVPTGWLVVLGGSGAGKTMLMLRTVRDLVVHRESGDPVPVFVSMSSWDPDRDSLRAWLEKQLPIDYSGLDTVVSRGEDRRSRIAILLDEQRIVPFLDGLDEMPMGSQVAAINQLNRAFTDPKRPLRLVMSCLTKDYRRAVGKPEEDWNPLRAAAVIELHPLDPGKVSSYLGERGKNPRWAKVDEQLRRGGSDLAKALNTPLYASLASAIYNASPHVARGKAPRPGELCERSGVESIHNHLLDKFIPAAYAEEQEALERRARDEGEEPGQLPAEHWLMVLADHLTNDREKPLPSLEWWNLKELAPPGLAPGVAGTVCGIATAVAAVTGTHVGVGIGVGFGTGMLLALAIGISAFHIRKRLDRKESYHKRSKERRPGPGMAGGMIGAVIGGVAAGVAHKYHIGHQASLFSGVPEALGMAIGAGASTDFFGGLAGTLVGAFVGGCLAGVGLGLPAGLVNGLGVGLAVALAIENVGHQRPSRRRPKWDKEIGIPGGLVIGAAIGLIAWRQEGVVFGIVFGMLLAVFAAVPFGLRHKDENLEFVPSPGQSLARDREAFRLTALSAGLAAGAAGFLGGSMTSIFEVGAKPSLSSVIGDGLGIGVASGLVIGLTFGFYHAASPEFRIISWWLAIRGRAPWRFTRFLEDAHRVTVLRQSGATYEFRHKELQLRLAARFRDGPNQSGVPDGRPQAMPGAMAGAENQPVPGTP